VPDAATPLLPILMSCSCEQCLYVGRAAGQVLCQVGVDLQLCPGADQRGALEPVHQGWVDSPASGMAELVRQAYL
jgi:hypothetical protein